MEAPTCTGNSWAHRLLRPAESCLAPTIRSKRDAKYDPATAGAYGLWNLPIEGLNLKKGLNWAYSTLRPEAVGVIQGDTTVGLQTLAHVMLPQSRKGSEQTAQALSEDVGRLV